MPINNIFIIASFILGFLLVAFIRTYDIHEKEPYSKMLLVTVWGGFWSVVLSLAQYYLAETLEIRIYHNFFGAIFIIGPIEELSKFIALLSSYFFIKKELNEPTDGLIYMSCVALGFSLIENYFYAVRSIDSGYLLWLRLFISTPGHIFFSAFMGIAFFSVTKQKKGFSLLIVSFIYASLIHGLFNGVIFHSWLLIFFILVIRFSYYWTFTLLSYTTSKSPFRESLSDFLMNSESKMEKGIKCLQCGDEKPKKTFKKGKIIIQKCNNCPCYVSNHDSIYYIFHHFGSEFRNMTNQYYPRDEKSENKLRQKYASVFKGNYICNLSRKAFFFLDELSSAIEEYNLKLQSNIEEKWWFPEILKSEEKPRTQQNTALVSQFLIIVMSVSTIIGIMWILSINLRKF